jgi:hypothetical protein
MDVPGYAGRETNSEPNLMLLQTNSYIVPKEKRAEHARLMRRFRQILNRVGCDQFEVYEQVGANWSNGQTAGRFVQIMRFRDRRHQLSVQNAERTDPAAQQLIAEFCELINYPYQQQQQQFAVGFYSSVLPVAPQRGQAEAGEDAPVEADTMPAAEPFGAADMAAELLDDEAPPHAEPQAESEALAEESPTENAAAEKPPAEDAVAEESAAPNVIAEAGEDTLLTDEAQSDETPAVDESATDEKTLADDLFAGDDDLSLPEAPHAEVPVADAAATASHPEAGGEIDPFESAEEPVDEELLLDDAEASPHAQGDSEDDDISRLAEELSAGDADLHGRARRPHRRGPASENGAH